MKLEADIVTRWVTVTDRQSEPTYVPEVAALYRIHKWVDRTGSPAEGIREERLAANLVVVRCQVDERVLAEIAADPRVYVVWSEPAGFNTQRRKPITSDEHGGLGAWLAQRGVDAGARGGATGRVTDTTREQLADRLKTWIRTQPLQPRPEKPV